MAIGICPGDVFPFRIERERIKPAPERKREESDQAFATRCSEVEEHNARVRALEAAGKVTTWQIRCLSSRDQGRCVAAVNRQDWEADVVRLGLAGWDEFRVKGQPLQFRGAKCTVLGKEREDVVTDDVLDRIPFAVVAELARGIFQLGMTEDEAGNS